MVRVINPTDLQSVTADATAKTRFVIIDCVGATDQQFVETSPMDRKRSVSLSTAGLLLMGPARVVSSPPLFSEPARESAGLMHPVGRVPPIQLGEALRSLLKPGPYYYLIACQAMQGAVGWIIIGWVPTLIREKFNLSQGAAGFSALGFLYGSQFVGLLLGGYWSDRWSLTNPRARIIIPAAAVMLTAPAFFATGLFPHLFFSLLSLSLWGLSMGIFGANTMPIVCLVVDERYRATAVGLINACIAICGGFALYGVGALRDAKINITLILALTGVGVFLCGLFLWLVNTSLKKAERAVVLTGA